MKKFISIFAVVSILVSMLALGVSAEGADIQFSASDVEGTTGDTVTVDVFVDKNAGTYGAKFWILYDYRCFDLLSVTNGDVFPDRDFQESLIDNPPGEYVYYSEGSGGDSLTVNNTNTGLLVTLEFKILKSAPNGKHDIILDLSDRPDLENPALSYRPGGFFFDVTNDNKERTVEMTKAGSITVTGSTADPLPETTEADTSSAEDPDKETSSSSSSSGKDTSSSSNTYETEWVAEVVTDDEGETVTDEAGEAVTTMVPIAIPNTPETTGADGTTQTPETEIIYVTDTDGETVTDEAGEPVTQIAVIEPEGEGPTYMKTVALIICIVAVVVAAVLIAVVIIMSKSIKKNNEE